MAEPPPTTRLDVALVQAALARSRGQAREAIHAGVVQVDGRTVTKTASLVDSSAELVRTDDVDPWVGRGAYKLLAALQEWGPRGLRVEQVTCIDVGASTGGFTQVLLHFGAARVLAIDVGTGQLVPELAQDSRVCERSGTHVLKVTADEITPADLIVMDLSFISAATVLTHVASWCVSGGSIVVLVKPQFEVGREALGRGGIVRSRTQRQAAVRRVLSAAYGSGLALRDLMVSPITGSAGNVEYLLWLSPAAHGMMDQLAAVKAAGKLVQKGLR
ncbi:MAG: TlyA family RNA methyltransferase [Ornithinimicrobium sp.]